MALLLHPIEGLAGAGLWTVVGLAVAAATVTGLGLARRISKWLPGRLGLIAASIPVIVSPLPFAAAFALSIVTNSIGALTGWVLLAGLDPSVGVLSAAVVVPLASSAAYLPFTVGGAGVREAAFVALAGAAVGMSEADGMASSLALWGSQLVVAGAGGIAQLIAPLSRPSS